MSDIDFLHADNTAGQTLLSLVARGNAIITEELRLSDHIPPIFLGSPNDPAERAKYEPILFDFNYLKKPETFDAKIDADTDLIDLDEEFRENNFELLERFYKLFESIFRYAQDWVAYLDELVEGNFVQHTVEGVLLDVEGRQLMCEALYLYGVMLLLLDLRIPGPTREMMIVSYYRYKGQGAVGNIDQVCKLCRTTTFSPKGKRPKNYPEEYFARFKLPSAIIDMILARLRADDIYNHTSAYPSPSHRSTALSSQGAMLYVILYFSPNVLNKSTSTMREIVDKFFNDNWVLNFYMGFTVDLSDAWEPYPAARKALGNIITPQNVEEVTKGHVGAIPRLNQGLEKYLTEGVLLDEYILDNIRELLSHVRNCNVTIRWLFLHRTCSNKKFRENILGAVPLPTLIKLLMDTAQYEFKVKTMLKRLLDTRPARWEECRKEASDRMIELSEYFTGEKALTRVKRNSKLQSWFSQLSAEILKLDHEQSVAAGRKIASLLAALEDVQEFHQIESNLQIKQFLADTSGYLKKMIRTVNVTPKVIGDLDIVSDFSFAWDIINDYTSLLHEKIRHNPNIVLLLRATFLKLASILDKPLVRITQCESKDDVSVAEYYSSSLVAYVRRVLEVIPQSVFKILDGIIKLQTHTLKQLPTKLERKHLKDYSQLDERYALARATHQVSVFTQGILAMSTTLLGIIKLDPRQILEDGIRKELVRQIAEAMNDFCVFKTGQLKDFETRLTSLGQKLDGYRQSFEYIQDYINIYGLKIWQEEFSRIINYNVEQESNEFLKKKVYDWQSVYQNDAIPIPTFPKSKYHLDSVNFMGRLVRELLSQTDCKKTVYVESMQGWYDLVSETEVIGIRTFSLLHRGVGIFGLTGIDKLICFMIVRDLTTFARYYRKAVHKSVTNFITKLTGELHPTSQFPPNTTALYSKALNSSAKLSQNFLGYVTKIGQAQLIRRQITNELNFSCKLESKILCCALENLNTALITEVKKHYTNPDTHSYPGNPTLPNITKYLENSGISNPITKIYITTEPLPGVPILMFLLVLSQVTKLEWNTKFSTLTNRQKGYPLDGAPFIMGVITILKQFHSSHTHTFLAYLGQYVRANVSVSAGSSDKAAQIPPDVINVLLFLEEFCRFSYTSRKAIEALVPSYLFDRFSNL